MKKVVVMFVLLAVGAVAQAQKVKPSSNVITEQRTVMNFSQLVVSDGIEVVVLFTGTEKVDIQAPDNVVQFVEAAVEKDVLNIRFRKGFKMKGNAAIRVTVNMKSATKITAVNKSRVALGNALAVEKLEVRLTDATLEGALAVNKASMVLAKGAKANLTGTCKELKLSLSGASTVGSTALSADVVEAKLSGQCTARLTITQSVEFNGAKGSTLYYLGNPKIKGIKASGDSGLFRAD